MPYKLGLNTGPSLNRVILIALLLTLEAILISVGAIFNQGRMPTELEIGGILALAGTQLVTYILGFLKKEES